MCVENRNPCCGGSMLIASRRSHIPSSNYSTPPSLQTTTQEATTAAAAAKKERTRELPQDTNRTQKRHEPKDEKNKQAHTERTTTQTERDRETATSLPSTSSDAQGCRAWDQLSKDCPRNCCRLLCGADPELAGCRHRCRRR
jgi:hypothetical protein